MLRAALTIAVVLALNLVACGDAPERTQVTESESAPDEPTEAPSAPAEVVDPPASAQTESTGLDRVHQQLQAFGQSRWKALEQEQSAAGGPVVWRITAYDHPPALEVDTAGYCVRIGKLMGQWAPDQGWEAQIEQGGSVLRSCDAESWESIYHPQLNPDAPKD
jgi:hypothetical protein